MRISRLTGKLSSKGDFLLATLGVVGTSLSIYLMQKGLDLTLAADEIKFTRSMEFSKGVGVWANYIADTGLHWLDTARSQLFEKIMAGSDSDEFKSGVRCIERQSVSGSDPAKAISICRDLMKQGLF